MPIIRDPKKAYIFTPSTGDLHESTIGGALHEAEPRRLVTVFANRGQMPQWVLDHLSGDHGTLPDGRVMIPALMRPVPMKPFYRVQPPAPVWPYWDSSMLPPVAPEPPKVPMRPFSKIYPQTAADPSAPSVSLRVRGRAQYVLPDGVVLGASAPRPHDEAMGGYKVKLLQSGGAVTYDHAPPALYFPTLADAPQWLRLAVAKRSEHLGAEVYSIRPAPGAAILARDPFILDAKSGRLDCPPTPDVTPPPFPKGPVPPYVAEAAGIAAGAR